MRIWVLSGLFTVAVFADALANEADQFFDDSYVHEIRIYFADPDWYDALIEAHTADPDDPYFQARFEFGSTALDPVGVRFKGNSSYRTPGTKKSIKIDFDEYREDDPSFTFFGLAKLNLNNGFKDPTFLREKLFLEFASRFVPAIRTVHVNVYINDTLWGLYTAVEQVNKDFLQGWFGAGEDGNLFKAETSDAIGNGTGFGSGLTWLGTNAANYRDRYQLKTNEAADDYSQLIEFINVLNNTPAGDLRSEIESLLDVPTALKALADGCHPIHRRIPTEAAESGPSVELRSGLYFQGAQLCRGNSTPAVLARKSPTWTD